MVTAQMLVDLVKSRMEPTEPADTILKILTENNGKRLDKRIVDKLQLATGQKIRDRRQYGMTSLTYGGYDETGGRQGGCLYLAHQEKNVVIDVEYVKEHNPAYFKARDERNADRIALLTQPEEFKELAMWINHYIEAVANIKRLTEFGAPFQHDSYAIEKLAGMRND
jgi:hypothetical protein